MDKLIALFQEHSSLIFIAGGISLASLLLILALLPVIILRMPEDYFTRSKTERKSVHHGIKWVGLLMLYIFKNILGIGFVLLGIIMLLTPGQGLLTIFVGVLLINFPGKTKLELSLIRKPKILHFVNNTREKSALPPIEIPE